LLQLLQLWLGWWARVLLTFKTHEHRHYGPSISCSWYAGRCSSWELREYCRLYKAVSKKYEIKMGKWRLSRLIIYVKYLKASCAYIGGSVWTGTTGAVWHENVSDFVTINTTNWYVNVCWPN
jgi:hypothetical protein